MKVINDGTPLRRRPIVSNRILTSGVIVVLCVCTGPWSVQAFPDVQELCLSIWIAKSVGHTKG
jgi:hypothetical protein